MTNQAFKDQWASALKEEKTRPSGLALERKEEEEHIAPTLQTHENGERKHETSGRNRGAKKSLPASKVIIPDRPLVTWTSTDCE